MAESRKRQSTLSFFRKNETPGNETELESDSSKDLNSHSGEVKQTTEEETSAKQLYEKKRKRHFKEHWKSEFPWLALDESRGKMYCFYCKENEALTDKSSPLFTGCGSDGNYRRDPLASHVSKCHLACTKEWRKHNEPEYEPAIKKAVHHMIKSLDEKQREHLKALTNTGFFVAKEGLAFRKFSGLGDLQEKNGVQMGDMYRNEKKCSQFVASIADVEKETAITEVKESRFLSVLSDGSTDAGITEQETVFVRYVDKQGHPCTKFVYIVPLESATAVGVCKAITTACRHLASTRKQ